MTKVITFLGTRSELIRLSRVITRLAATVDHQLVHTGQNWDPALRDIFFDELRLPKPDHDLQVDTSSLGRAMAGILVAAERVIEAERPDAVLVLGGTNSCLAAVMARRLRVPVYHLEAGHRGFDANVPEETNRRLVDHVADFNLVTTEHARRNLLAEGLHPRRILHIGSPMREVLTAYQGEVAASPVLTRLNLSPGGYFLVSAHREENVDDPARLHRLLACLRAVRARWNLPVLVSTHPRTRRRLTEHAGAPGSLDGVVFHEPFGFFDYVHLQTYARCTLSDSGAVTEESAILGFPAVALRDAIERPEALDAGSILVSGLDPDGLVEAIAVAVKQAATDGVPCPADYRIPDTSRRVVDYLLSTVRRHHEWAGIRRRPS
jgi:UDP-N-acetyl-L-fucosamine synthase